MINTVITWLDKHATITSIIIFVLGFFISELIRKWNKSKELKQQKKIIEEWIMISNSNIEQYLKSLSDLCEKIKNNQQLIPASWACNQINISRVNNIPLEVFYNIYIYNLKFSSFRLQLLSIIDWMPFSKVTVIKQERENRRTYLINLLNAIEYIDKVTPNIIEAYKTYEDRSKEVLDKWNTSLLELNNILMTLYKKTDKFEYDIINDIVKLYSTCIKHEGGKHTPMNDWSNNFITPSLKIFIKNDPEMKKYQSLTEISILINRLRVINAEYQDLKKFYEVFNIYHLHIKTSKEQITKAIDYFSNKNIYNFIS